MSRVKTLQISGVRSFGPEEKDKQIIEFKRPLTLILGDNGCGKTTIIESLKYALCGELPPNCNKGQSFVYDPTVNKTDEVKAQIRLRFSDAKNIDYMVVRSMQTLRKQKSLQFKTVDSTIKTRDGHGDYAEISGRCGDTDDTIASILGVSKAVLNFVIFCHQEDSNWPLEGGKRLKERFDAIFDATKYNNCINKVMKLRTDYGNQIKLLKKDVLYLSEKKEEYDSKRLKIVNDEEEIENTNEKLKQLSEKLIPIKHRLNVINVVETNMVKFSSQKENIKTRIEFQLQQQNKLKANIKVLYTKSVEDLTIEIESFETNILKQEKQQNEVSSKLTNARQLETNTVKNIHDNEIKINELFTSQEQHQEKIDTKNKHLLAAAKNADLAKLDDIQDEKQSSKLFEQLQKKLRLYKTEHKESIDKADEDEKTAQINIDDCREASARHSQKILNKQKECTKMEEHKRKCNSDIAAANESKENLDSIKNRILDNDRILENLANEFDVKASEEFINKDENTVINNENSLEELTETINTLQEQRAKQDAMNAQKKQIAAKEKSVMYLKNKNRDSMVELLGADLPTGNFVSTFAKLQTDIQDEVDNLNKQLKSKQHEIISLEANKKNQKETLDAQKKELTSAEEELEEICGQQPILEAMNKISMDIQKLEDEKCELSSSVLYKKFLEKLDHSDCCPLCHTTFESEENTLNLKSELQGKIKNVPKRLEDLTKRLSSLTAKRDRVVALRPLELKVKNIKEKTIPSLEEKLNKTSKSLQICKDEVEEISISVTEPEHKLTIVSSMLSDMPLLDQSIREVNSITAEVKKLQSQLNVSEEALTLPDAISKQTSLRQENNELRKCIKSKQTELKKHNELVQKTRESKNTLTEQLLKMQAKIQELCSLHDQLKNLDEALLKEKLEINSLMENKDLLKAELQNAEKQKKQLKEEHRKTIKTLSRREDDLEGMISKIVELIKEIENHKAKDIPGKIDKMRITLNNLNKERDQLNLTIEAQTAKLETMKEQIFMQNINKRDLIDNKDLRNSQKEEKELLQKMKTLDEKIGELDCASLSVEKTKLIQQENSTLLGKARAEEKIKQIQSSIKLYKEELMKSTLKNVHKEYKEKFCRLELMKAADEDLRQYITAMDLCLMKFHKEKMENINRIIRQMWGSIYRGNDVDSIEIKTDEISSSGTGTKRVYNYRVVQRRHDTEIDMAGKCSAGQKVLACVIIRMALAETFSNRFGVMALDEPTTNLDCHNISGLCNSLREIVTNRMQQNNFMFIVITHDLEFLRSIGTLDKLNHYYSITRNRDGKSRISKEVMP